VHGQRILQYLRENPCATRGRGRRNLSPPRKPAGGDLGEVRSTGQPELRAGNRIGGGPSEGGGRPADRPGSKDRTQAPPSHTWRGLVLFCPSAPRSARSDTRKRRPPLPAGRRYPPLPAGRRYPPAAATRRPPRGPMARAARYPSGGPVSASDAGWCRSSGLLGQNPLTSATLRLSQRPPACMMSTPQ
jgi:hypothetical protein